MFYILDSDNKYPDVWYNERKVPFSRVDCPVFSGHSRAEKNNDNISIEIKRKKMGDFVSTVFSDWLITERTAVIFEKQQLTGYKLREVDISNKVLPFKLWEIIAVGKAKIHPDSGLKELYRCEHCGLVIHGHSNNNIGIKIDISTWDGCDFFNIEENQTCVFVSENVKKVVGDHRLTGVLFLPSTELSLGYTFTDADQNWTKEQWRKHFEK